MMEPLKFGQIFPYWLINGCFISSGEMKRRVFGYDSGGMSELRLFNDTDELAKKNIESAIEFKKRKLDKNFEILDERLQNIDKFFEGSSDNQTKPIKPPVLI